MLLYSHSLPTPFRPGPWQELNTSDIGVSDLRFGDFDGNGRTDVFAAWGGKWHVSFNGTEPWDDDFNTSDIGGSDLRFGNFNVRPGPMQVGVGLRISRFRTTALTNAEADRILTLMSNVLQTKDDASDVACLVQFRRAGRVTAFVYGDGSIDSQAEYNAVILLPGHVKVVYQITYCNELKPNIIGCAPTPGSSQVVVRVTAAQEGILWAHEYGHTRGLLHRYDDDGNDDDAVDRPPGQLPVMYEPLGCNRTNVNASECRAFRR